MDYEACHTTSWFTTAWHKSNSSLWLLVIHPRCGEFDSFSLALTRPDAKELPEKPSDCCYITFEGSEMAGCSSILAISVGA